MANWDAPPEVSLAAAVNEVIDNLHSSLGLPDSEFFCECDHVGCKERLVLTRAEFARFRCESEPVVAAAHAYRVAGAEVIELRGRVSELPEKVGVAGEVAAGRHGGDLSA